MSQIMDLYQTETHYIENNCETNNAGYSTYLKFTTDY